MITANSISASGGGGVSTVVNHKSSWVKTFTQGTYLGVYNATDGSGTDTAISPLAITVTPQSASSYLMLEWVLFGESTAPENQLFIIKKDGVILADSTDGTNGWSGLSSEVFDNQDTDTAQTVVVRLWDTSPNVGVSTQYDVCSRSSRSAASCTFYLNRCIVSTGASAQETGTSTGTVIEYL